MFEILKQNYYIDLDKMEEFVEIDGLSGETQIHLVKYETIKLMLDVVFSEQTEVDEEMVFKTTDVTIPFKLAFNTLLVKGIINKI
jgi:hypothetical protein